jgi:hypothetical protein
MAVTVFKPEEQNTSQAPTLGQGSGTFGANAQQRKNIAQGGSGRFTNLQQYVQANESNPNAQLLQKEAQARQGELETRQQEFTRQAEPIKQQFEGIRSGQQFVQNALQDPTRIVQDPSQLQRFTQYRTQGIGDVETPFQQLQGMRGALGTQQEQIASGLETIQRDPNALQNFIQSQRANPALATRGENVLDRFLTQSTESGQRAIAGLGTTAGAIRSTQAPSIIQDVESLRTQAQRGPLASSDVINLVSGAARPEENYLRNINKEEVYRLSGISKDQIPTVENLINQYNTNKQGYEQNVSNIERINNILKSNYREYNPDTTQTAQGFGTRFAGSFGVPNVPGIDFGKYISGAGASQTWQQALAGYIINNLNKPQTPQGPTETELAAINDVKKREQLSQLINERNSAITEANRLVGSGYDISQNPLSQKYKTFEQYYTPQTTKQQVLQGLDPTRLSRIQALQQLAGTNQFNSLLSGGIQ